jgi:transmembrane sensor
MTSSHQATSVIITDELKIAIGEASRWYSRFNSGFNENEKNTSKADQLAWQKWLQKSPINQQAWTQVELVQAEFGAQPANLLSPALKAVDSSRRELLQRLSLLVFVVPLGGLSYRYLPWQHWQADYNTGLGERQDIQLPDGSLLVLDTNTVLDVHYDENQRLITLHSGRIMITTAKDITTQHNTFTSSRARPFSVNTPQGRVIALGTRFSVASHNGTSEVAVFEKSVTVHPKMASNETKQESQMLNQGESIRFTANSLAEVTLAESTADTWVKGYLVVVDIALVDLLRQFSRYRPGILRCSNDIAQLKISGSFPLDDTERSLSILEQTFPLKQRRLTGYWVSIEATNT